MFGFKKLKWIQQHDLKDCGPACIAAICHHYKAPVSISKIRTLAHTDQEGTTLKGLLKALTNLGFEAEAFRGTKESLKEIPLPAIAHIITPEGILHYVVLHKISNKHITLMDPSLGIKKYSYEEFYKLWTGILVLTIPKEIQSHNSTYSPLKSYLIQFILTNKRILSSIFILSILFNTIGILGAFYYSYLIDVILPKHLTHTLEIVSLSIILLYILKMFINYSRTYLLLKLSKTIDIELMLGYYNHVIRLPISFFETRRVGEIISRFLDAGKIREALSNTAITLSIDTIMLIVGSYLLYLQNTHLFLITLLFVPIYILIITCFQKPYEQLNKEEMQNGASLNSYLVESLKGILTVKSYVAENVIYTNTKNKFLDFWKVVLKKGKLIGLQDSIKQGVQLIGGILILWIGGHEVLRGNMTIGQLITYNALLLYFLQPIENLVRLQPSIQSALVAWERVQEILELETEYNKKTSNSSLNEIKSITINNVSFGYGLQTNILKDITLKLQKGEHIGLVGESGSGKTTIAKLLLKYYKFQKGEILFNDISCEELNENELRKKIIFLSQESFFFEGSIYENICFGLDYKPSLEQVIDIAEMLNAHSFINSMPLKYHTMIEEDASNLSAGQKQRLSLVRAILAKPEILILDEATSNLDSTTEQNILSSLQKLKEQGLTIISIAHRLSTIKNCNQIYVLNNGHVLGQGTHAELIEKNPEYQKLWKNQFPNENKKQLA
ncbi:peptidase domain-containing ABC transporter [Bacillus mycoides]|uniref:peptidase domain-containing ABC transporter n=1 Tax=Bacillus mycoides TaxID=1405 RepID=UPI001FDDF085|nr:peptidase domain-containing ABC transporter [Bacillus mycoides]CAH2465612.1 Peptidase C39 family [Bacillus mycoides KBAB4]